MKRKIISILALAALLMVGCQSNYLVDEVEENPLTQVELIDDELYIVKERTERWNPVQEKSEDRILRSLDEPVPQSGFLGFGFGLRYSPIESVDNISWSLLDIEALKRDYPMLFTEEPQDSFYSDYFTYAKFDKYTDKSNFQEKLLGDIDVNAFSLNGINSKKVYNSFGTSTESSYDVYAEANMLFPSYMYKLNMENSSIRTMRDYMSRFFAADMYLMHPRGLINLYGEYMLSNYIVGGKAKVIYHGETKKLLDESIRESELNTVVEASLNFGVDGENLSVGVNGGSSQAQSAMNSFENIKYSVSIVGGDIFLAIIMTFADIADVTDLSNWVNSLIDEESHRIIDIGVGGLTPISVFAKEENLKNKLNQYIANGTKGNDDFLEPSFCIYAPNTASQDDNLGSSQKPQELDTEISTIAMIDNSIKIYLKTRYGDSFLIKTITSSSGFTTYTRDKILRNEINRLSEISGVQISSNCSPQATSGARVFCDVAFDIFNEDYMSVTVIDGVTYLLTEDAASDAGQRKKYAFTIYNGKVLNEYLISNLIGSLERKELTMEQLESDYELNAL